MYTSILHRLVISIGAIVAIATFTLNMMRNNELVHSAFMAFAVGLAVSLISLFAIQGIASVLFKFLNEQRKSKDNEEQ